MPRPTKTNYAKLVLYTSTGTRMEVDGGPIGVLDTGFLCLTAAQREKALEKFKATHERTLAREAETPATTETAP